MGVGLFHIRSREWEERSSCRIPLYLHMYRLSLKKVKKEENGDVDDDDDVGDEDDDLH